VAPLTTRWILGLGTGEGIAAAIFCSSDLSRILAPHAYKCFLLHQTVRRWHHAFTRNGVWSGGDSERRFIGSALIGVMWSGANFLTFVKSHYPTIFSFNHLGRSDDRHDRIAQVLILLLFSYPSAG
jgi:hypothetical protein